MNKKNPLKFSLAKKIKNELSKISAEHPFSEDKIYDQLISPPNITMGHLSFPCFEAAKVFKRSPAELAKLLAEQIAIEDADVAQSVKIAGPYLNFFIKPTVIDGLIESIIQTHSFFQEDKIEHTEKTMIEYSQPNTHKELHVGHLRNACLGLSLVAIFRYLNFEVIAATFPGDAGTHVAKVLWYYKNINQEPVPLSPEMRGSWIGKMYSKSNNLLTEWEKNKDPKLPIAQQELTLVLAQLEKKSGDYYQLWKETREWSLTLMKNTYQWLGINFDQWYFESDVDSPSLVYAQELLRQGVLIKDQGAIGADLSAEGLGFCLVVKSDGNGLYATKDLELARQKFIDHKIQKNIYIVDNRQSQHFKQIFKILEKAGFPHAHQCFHLAYEMVELPTGAMSSRLGNFILADQLILQMEQKILDDYLEKNHADWPLLLKKSTAAQIAKAAICYGMLKPDPAKKIVFDMNEWLKLDGDSGPYLQYVCARINRLLKKYDAELSKRTALDQNSYAKEVEKEIFCHLLDFNKVINRVQREFKPSYLCQYLFSLGKLFNKFYAECPIGQAAEGSSKYTRLRLSKAVLITMTKGLSLLGISVPDEM
jgi:arginyl-tRNA synthetase